ncbi:MULTISPECIES: hypothetical protein [unclassified Advenella]|uniref:hypothetical protein n=1 Tax=unclassified Advenella TaxID=2685285 RepID=UPI00137478C3|nr:MULTISPECIES: hypothetical protein [unclassified Advenella]
MMLPRSDVGFDRLSLWNVAEVAGKRKDERLSSLKHTLKGEKEHQAQMEDVAKQWKQEYRFAFWWHSKGLRQDIDAAN